MVMLNSFSSAEPDTRCFYEPKDDIEVHELAGIVPYLIKASRVWKSYEKEVPISPELFNQIPVQFQRHFRKPHVG